MDIRNLDIAVVGGGYGGLAAAKALSVAGAQVTVYEQAPEIKEVGAGIGLRPSSLAQFRRWGVLDAITSVSNPSASFEILTADAHPIAEETWPEADVYGITTHLIHRGDFIDALFGILPAGMVKLGHRLEKVTDNGSSATLTFGNGKSVTHDLVIAADGIKSVIREQVFSDQQPIFAGEHAYRVVIDDPECLELVADGKLRMYLGHGTKVYVLPLLSRGQVSFDITALDPDGTWMPDVDLDYILKTVEGFDERIVNVTRRLDVAAVNKRAVYDIDPVDTWHTDSIVLLGDAAHAMCHHQGQGANSAILDAGAIADALVEADSVPGALAAYTAARKPVTDELQRLSRNAWSDDEVNDVFPGQKPGQIGATTSAPAPAEA